MRTLKNFCIACVRLYQLILAPLFISFGVQCRFTPSCSHYAAQALEIHGVRKGLALALCRLGRCHPFSNSGNDPVPLKARMEIGNG